MKIFFVSSSEYYRKYKDEYNSIKDVIAKHGGSKPLAYTDRKIEEFKDTSNLDSQIKLVKEAEKALKEADLVIANVTMATAGPGYDIATALTMKKPVLVLRNEQDSSPRSPHSLNIDSKLLTYRKYNKETIDEIVKNFIVEAKKKIDTKFILIIPAEIDRYLEWASSERRQHKAQIVRNALEDVMDKDKEWKAASKNI